MRRAFCDHQKFKRQRSKREQVKAAILVIGLENSVERYQRGQQGCDPNDAGADPAQDPRLGSDTEREQDDRQHEEGDCQHNRAALAQGQADVASDHEGEWFHAPIGSRLRVSSRTAALGISISIWVATIAIPPCSR